MLKKIAFLFLPLLACVLALVALAKTNAAGANLITNPSVETVNSSNSNLPANWQHDKWGTNTTTFTYLNNNAHTGSRSLYVNMTKYTSGDAKWYFNHVAVTPGTKYDYSEFYKSNVATEVDIEYTNTAGKLSYGWLGDIPASANWTPVDLSFTTPSNVASLTVFHLIDKVGWLQTDDFSLVDTTATTPTPPSVNLTAPAANATLSGSQTVSANASDTIGVAGVQFKVDNNNLGAEDTTAPYSVSLDTTTLSNGNHTISATAFNTSGLSTTVSETVNVQNVAPPTPPTVSFSAPASGATVSGSQTVSANASDAVGVTGVQFKLDGNNLGSEDTTAPYSTSWDTTTASNGSHTLTATAFNTSGLSTTATETVTVQNTVATPPPPTTGPNLIANPSLENSANGTTPDSWLSSNWGTNTTSFSYLNTGHTGSRSVKVQTTSYTNGAANWYYNDLPITAGSAYQYSNWYQSNVDTEVDAEVVMSNGTTSYYYLGAALASPTAWSQFTTTFTPPAGAKSMAIYQILAKVGYIVSDDYSLSTYTPASFNRGIVSINFDDGWLSQYTNGVPILQANGLTATFFIITDSSITNPDPQYMNVNQLITLKNDGFEIGNHTETHPDLTTLTSSQIQTEMGGAQAALQSAVGVTPTNFAYPYGAYNATTISIGKQVGFISQRSVNSGFNSKDSLDLTQLKIEEVDANITPAQVETWVNQAIAQKTWLILVYHEIDTMAPAGSGDTAYLTSPANLSTEMAYIKSSGVAVETTAQAINEILPQL